MTNNTGTQIGTTTKYLPFGGTRAGNVPTDKLFTGQRLDGTGLCYYNARYYDATNGRFISADPITHPQPLPEGAVIKGLTVYCTLGLEAQQTRHPRFVNPQEHNRYSYALNNPLRYYDPDGHQAEIVLYIIMVSGVVFTPEIAIPILVAAAGAGTGYAVAQTGVMPDAFSALAQAYREEATWQQVAFWWLFDRDKYNEFKAFNDDNGGNTGDPGYEPDRGNLKPADQKYLESHGIDLHKLKKTELGEHANISRWDVKIDTSNRSYWLLNKDTNATIFIARDFRTLFNIYGP
jgi:RHS repeat-associated protein